MERNRLILLPLGGAGEIGMNSYVYGYGEQGKERLILVDAGVTFPDSDTSPGVNLIFPDFSWLFERSKRVDGIFITHAHEDHIGALCRVCQAIKAPVFARPFTAEIAARKLEENGISPRCLRIVAPHPAETRAGPFKVSYLHAAHSVPEASALLLKSPGGNILHTGDFKFDESPVLGDTLTAETWKSVAGIGLKALVCDSTNVFEKRRGRSEGSVGPEIGRLVGQSEGMVVATTFASNVSRVLQIAEAGRKANREIVILGRAMHRMLDAATQSGVLSSFPRTIDPKTAARLHKSKLLVIATGSQGEPRSATAQLAGGKFHGIEMESGDTLLYSSKTIPGNEKAVSRIINMMAKKGVDVIDDRAEIYHVSGHPNEPDLEKLHCALKPESIIPMHGEYRHLLAHWKMAKRLGINSLIAENGTVVEFGKSGPRIAEIVDSGRIFMDGNEMIGSKDPAVRERRSIAREGFIGIVLTRTERKGFKFGAAVSTAGLPVKNLEEFENHLEDVAETALADANPRPNTGDEAKSVVARAARQEVSILVGKKPVVAVKIARRGK